MDNTPFKPDLKATVSIGITAASQRVQVFAEQGPLSIRVVNNSGQYVYINYGDVTVTAATTDIPIPPGTVEVLTLDDMAGGNGPLYVAAVGTATSGTIYFTPGRGF